ANGHNLISRLSDLKDHLLLEFPDNIKEHWTRLKTSIISAYEQTIGYQTKKHQDWFGENDSEIERIINKKRKAFQIWQRERKCTTKKKSYANAKAEVQRRTRGLMNTWWIKKAQEIQHLANTHDAQSFFKATKTIHGPINHGICPLHSIDSTTLLKDKEAIALHWKEDYQHFHNHNSHIAAEVLSQIPQKQIRDELAVSPNLGELCTAVNQMKNSKASGPDGIPAKVSKVGGTELTQQLHKLIEKIWEREEIPADFMDAKSINLFLK
ncbi:Hypothetical predicted protein, partial [Podarcis lilfordi]